MVGIAKFDKFIIKYNNNETYKVEISNKEDAVLIDYIQNHGINNMLLALGLIMISIFISINAIRSTLQYNEEE